MMKRTILLSLILLLAAALMLSACGGDVDVPGETDNTTLSDTTETAEPADPNRLSDKYLPGVSNISLVAGTFTDRMTAEDLNATMMGEQAMKAPLLYNLIKRMNLTRDDIILYSEMNGNLLDSAEIDALFLADENAMREALRGKYTIMAGGMPYTVYELSFLDEETASSLGLTKEILRTYLADIPAIAEKTGEVLDEGTLALIAKYTAN